MSSEVTFRGAYQRDGLKQRGIARHDDVEDVFKPAGNPGRAIRVVLPPPFQAGRNQVLEEIIHPVFVGGNWVEADNMVDVSSGVKGDDPLSESRVLVRGVEHYLVIERPVRVEQTKPRVAVVQVLPQHVLKQLGLPCARAPEDMRVIFPVLTA